MAEYRKLSLDLIAADGNVDETEVKLLKKHLYADGKIDHDEVVYLMDLRAALARKDKDASFPHLDKLVLKAVTDYLMTDGKSVTDTDLALVKKIAGDKKIDMVELKKFLTKLKKDMASNAGVVKLVDEWMKKNAPVA